MTPPAVAIDASDDADAPSGERRRARHALVGLGSSAAAHCVASLLVGVALLGLFDLFWLSSNPDPRVLIVAGVEERVEPIAVTMEAPEDEFAPEKLLAEHLARGDDWSFELVDAALLADDAGAPLPEEAVAAKWVEQATDQSRERSSDENLDQLDELAERLSSVSSQEAVGDIGSVLSRAMKLEDRATAPVAQASERKFEISSAQLHDVRIETDEATGAERYVATLVDRHGTSIEQEMDAGSGKQAYDVMQTIKKYPLLESVYRAVVMKILDRLIEPTGAPQGS
jgi:hypothetical protein